MAIAHMQLISVFHVSVCLNYNYPIGFGVGRAVGGDKSIK